MSDKLLAEWFWTDRWMGSSAFGLPIDARGLYREMLTQAWRRQARLPNDHDQIRRMTGVTLKEWRKAWPLVERFWRVEGDLLVNDTQIEVYQDAQSRSRRSTNRARIAAQARHKQSTSTAQAGPQALLKHCPPSPSPSPNSELRKEERVSRRQTAAHPGDAVGFVRFWAVYPNKKGKAEALKAWLKRRPSDGLTDLIVAAVSRQCQWPEWTKNGGQFIPHPATWLNRGSWDDEPNQGNGSLLSDTARYNIAASEEAGRLIEEQEARRGH